MNEVDVRRAQGKLRLAMERLAHRYPFHVALLERMRVTESCSIATMAVTTRDEDIVLLHNLQFVLGCSVAELGGVLLHEVHHVLFGHLAMDPKDYPDKWALTVAQEVTVNEFIVEPLPRDPLKLEQFPKLPPKESTIERYRRLHRKPSKSRSQASTLDDHSVWSEIGDIDQAKAAVIEAVEDAAALVGPAQIPEELRELLKALIGRTPGSIQEAIFRGGKGTLDWRNLLRRYVGQVLEIRPVYNRPPRRFPSLVGILPGRGRRATKPKVMAVVDTSGSISSEELTRIDGELKRMTRDYSVMIVECDTTVHAVYEYRPLEFVHGRGGSDLRPPLERDFLRQHRPDVVVYFTDGYGPAPEQPPRVPLIWCLTEDGERPAAWGKVVQMK